MNSFDVLSLSLRNLLRRKTRTVLAIIGVVIGICAIIVMLSIGFGQQDAFRATVEQWGNLHLVSVYQSGGGEYVSMGSSVSASVGPAQQGGVKQIKLDDRAIAAIEKIPGVAAASPRETAQLSLMIDNYLSSGVNVIGVRPEVLEKFNYKVEKGEFLKPGDKESILFGNQIPISFFNPRKTWGSSYSGEPPVDVLKGKISASADWNYGRPEANRSNEDKVEYDAYSFRGVGVLANPDDYDTAYNIYMHIDTVKRINEDTARAEKRSYDKNAGYREAMVYVSDIEDVRAVSESIRGMGLQTSSLNDALEMMQDQARMTQAVLGGIGAVSLLVAALGITNTMIMSIYERTKEIGIMKVLGADLPDIRRLFLTEAAIIGFAGGLLGIALSYGASLLMNTALLPVIGGMLGGMSAERISVIPLWLPAAALGFSTAIGLISGYSPARRAMNLSALESIRNE
ncbi:MAG: ABC transporter permease [Clostridiales Family XIII bacterium]|jgi:ABC-type lipoprotein release transport system permease subunit|nr:ABC transporter permease [Clostridiales Family XIII bacterium]